MSDLCRRLAPRAAVLIALAGLACDSTGPDVRPEGDLTIISRAATSPPLEASVLEMYAVRGQAREGAIFFQNEVGGRGEEFLRLKFEDDALLTDENGLPVAPGDSVRITVTVLDESLILFDFQPSGIVFNPLEMPHLEIRYAEAEGDFDDDGDSDAEDAEIEGRLAIWRQETLTSPFIRLGSFTFEELDEIEAELPGFTRYAIAY